MKVLVTGGAGLVGSECCKLLDETGYDVISVDNYKRGEIFGRRGDTESNIKEILKEYDIEHHKLDIRDDEIKTLIKKSDAIIHTAAQPSHPRSEEIPMEDFQINAYGTLKLLELVRKYNRDIPFVFCSTNKVYGEMPNFFSFKKVCKRFEPKDPMIWDGFDESLRVDQNMHTPFGVSKLAADLYTLEYAKLYGLKAASFRMGCITGGAAKAVELHNWEPYFVGKALSREKITIYGYRGYQVRDVIHAKDLARLFLEYIKNPRPGEAYNVGGGRKNSISILESFDLIEDVTGERLDYVYGKQRKADHQWWISNISKVRTHYPKWDVKIGLKKIFQDIYEALASKSE